MNYFFTNILLAVCLFVSCFSYEYDVSDGLHENRKGHGNGKWKEEDNDPYNMSEHVFYWLYTRNNTTGQLLNRDKPRMIESTTYNPSNPLKVIVHGWLGSTSEKDSFCNSSYSSYFKVGNYNVICVDWKEYSTSVSYNTAKQRAKYIGKDIAKVLKKITNNMTKEVEKIHLIGHSMGAHIVGFTGRILTNRIPRITGLDPTLSFYDRSDPDGKLNKSDAKFVDIIHTNSDQNGVKKSIGHIDFFPNGGELQPACGPRDKITGSCSHKIAYRYFAHSIWAKGDYIATKCTYWNNYVYHLCDKENKTYMGEFVDQSQTGNFFLRTFTQD